MHDRDDIFERTDDPGGPISEGSSKARPQQRERERAQERGAPRAPNKVSAITNNAPDAERRNERPSRQQRRKGDE